MSATRLLALAPASVQSQAEALKPLLELFFSNLGQGIEPLELAESHLPDELISAIAALPLVLDKKPDEPLKLWTAKGFKQQQRLLAQLVDLLKSHNGLLVTGGAGSGKTSLVRKLLGEANQPTALMAPTGKAAARLREAMAPMPEGMQCGTIHRWLEASGDGRFRRGPQRLLELSSVVIDEFSMVEITLLDALLAALPPGVKLFLLGDHGQLPPISGACVLAPLKAKLAAEAPQCLIELKGSHRFNQTTVLGEFVQQLRKGPIDLATRLQQLPETGNLGFYNLNLGWPIELTERLNLHRKQLLIAAEDKHCSDQDALNTLLELMLLAPRRKGRHGVDQLNERWLGLDRNNPLAWPVGTPVLINRNNNEKGLSNGDLGLIRSDERGRKVAVIASGDGAQRIPLELLVGVEPALAITVHKSQGSQAKQVIVVINETEGLDPRLLYTALTRAQDRADLLFSVP